VEFERTRGAGEGEGELTDDQIATIIFFFFLDRGYSPFFIKRSELQVSYERTLIAQITDH
jgi:hypothetical protein